MIKVKCQACGAEFSIPPSMAGRRARCTCGEHFTIPLLEADRPEVDPQALQNAKWYVSTDEGSEGPISFEDVRKRVARGDVRPGDKVYADPLGDWKRLEQVEALRPGREDEADRWYVSRKGNRYGPYKTGQMKDMIREGRLGPKTRAWTPSMGEWRTLRNIGRFAEILQARRSDQAVEEVWYHMRSGRRRGPLSLEQMVEAAREGRIRPSDRVWSNRLQDWQDARDVAELEKALESATEKEKGELWYYRHGGEVGGPVEFHELQDLIEQASVVAGDTVFSKKLGEWKDVRDVPKLRQAITAARRGVATADRESEQWYYMEEGQERGPVTQRFLAQRLASGDLGSSVRVFGPGSDEWRRAGNVPELARYLPKGEKKKEKTADETPTGTVEGRPEGETGMSFWRMAGLAAVGLLVIGMAVVLFVQARRQEAQPPPGPPPEEVFQVPETPKDMILAWLDLFLVDGQTLPEVERQTRGENLARFYAGNYMDVYAPDVRRKLRRAMEQADAEQVSLERLDRTILRAEDENNFCYHVPFRESEVTISKALPDDGGGVLRRKKVFGGRSFRPLRCYRLLMPGPDDVSNAFVLIMRRPDNGADEEGSPWVIVAMGRSGHVGAQAGPRRIRYLSGYKAPSMREPDCLLQVGAKRIPGTAGTDWDGFGELMSVDMGLVPIAVFQRRLEAVNDDVEADLLLVMATPVGSQTWSDVRSEYGNPRSSETVPLPSPDVRKVNADPDASHRLYSRITAHFYGDFGVAEDPASGDVVGFVFREL